MAESRPIAIAGAAPPGAVGVAIASLTRCEHLAPAVATRHALGSRAQRAQASARR